MTEKINPHSMSNITATEPNAEHERRVGLLAQLGLQFTPLSDEQNTAVDGLCQLLPLGWHPNSLATVPANDWRDTVRRQLHMLPQTNEVQRMLVQQPQ
jgi:hypothetical protein